MASREEEYLRRMKALGYEPSLAGMDEEDFDYVPSWAQNRPQETPLGQEYRPVDRDFAERILRMFERKWDPNWQMPDLDGPEYASKTRTPGVVEKIPEHWLPQEIPGLPGAPKQKPSLIIEIGGEKFPLEIDEKGRPIIRF